MSVSTEGRHFTKECIVDVFRKDCDTRTIKVAVCHKVPSVAKLYVVTMVVNLFRSDSWN